MDMDLSALDDRVQLLVSRFLALRDENIALRTRVAALEGENRRLGDNVDQARERIEALLSRLPEIEA